MHTCTEPALLAATKPAVKSRKTANSRLAVTAPPQKHLLWPGKGFMSLMCSEVSHRHIQIKDNVISATRSIQISA